MCGKNKVHISAFVRYDFAGFTKPKDIPTIELAVGFYACVLSSAEACSDITHTEKRIRRFFYVFLENCHITNMYSAVCSDDFCM